MPPLCSQPKLKPNVAGPVSDVPVRSWRKKRDGPGLHRSPQKASARGSVGSLPPSQKRLATYYPRMTIGIASIAIPMKFVQLPWSGATSVS